MPPPSHVKACLLQQPPWLHMDISLATQIQLTRHAINHTAKQAAAVRSNNPARITGTKQSTIHEFLLSHPLTIHSSVHGMPSKDATGMTVGWRSPAAADAGVNLNRCVSSASTTRASNSAKCWPKQLRGPYSNRYTDTSGQARHTTGIDAAAGLPKALLGCQPCHTGNW